MNWNIVAVILRYLHWIFENRTSWFVIVYFLNIIIFIKAMLSYRQSASRYNSYYRSLSIFKDNKNFEIIENFYNNEKRNLFLFFLSYVFWGLTALISNVDLFLRYTKIWDCQEAFLILYLLSICLCFFMLSIKKEIIKWLHNKIVKH